MKHLKHENVYSTHQKVSILLFLLLFALASCAVAIWIEFKAVEKQFQAKGDEAVRLLDQRISNIETILVSLAGLYHANDDLTSAEQSAFAQEMLKAYPFISAIIFAEWVPNEKVKAFERKMQKDGFISFKVKTSSHKAETTKKNYHLPISFIEPMDPLTANWLGYDPIHEPGIYQAIEYAISSGTSTFVGPASLYEHQNQHYFALKPIYLGRYPPNSATDRIEMFTGIAGLQIDLKDFIHGIHQYVWQSDIETSLSEKMPISNQSQEPSLFELIDKISLSTQHIKIGYSANLEIYGKDFVLTAINKVHPYDLKGWRAVTLWLSSLAIILLAISVHWNRKSSAIQEQQAKALFDAENARFKSVVDSAFDAIITANTNGEIVSWNQQACEMFGYNDKEVLGRNIFKQILSDESYSTHAHKLQSEICKKHADIQNTQLEVIGRNKNNQTFTLELSISLTRNDYLSILSVFARDISERKLRDEEIRYLAYHDALTGLPNRQAFKEHANKAIQKAKRHNRIGAILYLDLDEFKRINDTLGHELGDLLIQQVSHKLYEHLRSSDIIARPANEYINDNNRTIARLGGDEFTVLLEDLDTPEDAGKIARRIYKAISGVYNLDAHEVFITPSTGIAIFPDDGNDIEELLKNADTAMYHAKSMGKNNFQYYTEKMNNLMESRLGLEGKLRKALKNNEFQLYYQAQTDLHTGRTVSAEALLRWHQPELGNIPPAEFIPLAEETGLIIDLGEWVIRQACIQNRTWMSSGYEPIKISVNLSTIQFIQPNLHDLIHDILKENDLQPKLLELEITESTLMKNIEETIQTLTTLKKLGASIAIDDFGTGHSSLSYLKRLPLDILKIDRTFIKDIPSDHDDTAITSAIIAMAHQLQLEIVAEGVETETQMEILRDYGCEIGQGYYFSKPLPADDFINYLNNERSVASHS